MWMDYMMNENCDMLPVLLMKFNVNPTHNFAHVHLNSQFLPD
jgi:hypothetical protein